MEKSIVFVAERSTGRSTVGRVDSDCIPESGVLKTEKYIITKPRFDTSYQPTEASLYLTPACNLSCSYCYIVPFLSDSSGGLSAKDWNGIIDSLYYNGVRTLKLIGGEALLRSDIIEICKHAVDVGILAIELTTNATTQIIRSRIRELEEFARLDIQKIVSTSIDSHLEDENDVLRGKFRDVVSGIRQIKEIGLPVSVASVVTKRNVGHLEDMAKFAADMGIDAYQFNNLVPIQPEQRDLVITSRADKQGVVDRLERISLAYDGKMIVINRFVPAPNIAADVFERVAKIEDVRRSSLTGCPAGTREVYVLPDGKLVACPMFIRFEEYHSNHSIIDRDFADVWENDEKIKDFRKHVAGPMLYGACATCSSGSVCKGGCRAMTFFQGGTIEAQDPRCLV